MPIKCVSLEMSKKLKEAGFRQDTELYWAEYKMPEGRLFSKIEKLQDQPKERPKNAMIPCVFSGSAPTTDELLAELPDFISKDKHYYLHIEKCVGYRVYYSKEFGHLIHSALGQIHHKNESLPEALGEMYLFLAKEGLLTHDRRS